MKKLAIVLIGLALLVSGFAMADSGIKQVPETQGISTSTTINAVGNVASSTTLQWEITTNDDVRNPNLDDNGDTLYATTYSEDTQSHGVGLILYDKEMDVETSNRVTGLYNIEATKEIGFIGVDGARIVSSDNIFVDGAGYGYSGDTAPVICVFYPDGDAGAFPAYCNRAEAGSTIDMTVASVRTTTNDRFVMGASDFEVELNHDILVTELVDGLPSIGSASAFMEVLVQEGRDTAEGGATLNEKITFFEETSITGQISTFEKLMHYESGIVR